MKVNGYCFTECVEKQTSVYIQTFMNSLWRCRSLHFDTSLCDLDVESIAYRCERKTSAPVISKGFQSTLVEFCFLLRLVSLIFFVSFRAVCIQMRDPYLNRGWGRGGGGGVGGGGLHSDIYSLVSFKLGWWYTHQWPLHHHIGMNDHRLQSRSKGDMKTRVCAVFPILSGIK